MTGRIRLDGGQDIQERPALSIHVLGEQGEVLASEPVGDDGRFSLSESAVGEARRFVVTAREADPTEREAAFVLRPSSFRRALEIGELAIPAREWVKFLPVRRCVEATIRRCFPWPFVLDDLVARVKVLPQALQPIDVVKLLPIPRCAPLCEGRVEVYRRTCCCFPRVFPPLPKPPVEILPEPFPFPGPPVPPPPPPGPGPDPAPFGPLPPGPGPDPAPFEQQQQLLTNGTLDLTKVARLQRRVVGPEERLLPPFPWCVCGPPSKVAEGFVGEDGRVFICWWERLRLLPRNCHDEYAFVVRQNIGGRTVTVYDGLSAGQWFDADDDDITLTSYHPAAIACRETEFPVPVGGAFVVLQDLGSTESHRLRTPMPDGPDSVQTPGPPGADTGLLDLNAGPDYALGGNVHLRYHFSESMQGIGARYYRVQWAPANVFGDPDGDWETLPVPAWKTWRVVGSDIVPGSHSLGPNTVGGQYDLFHIPFESGAPLAGDEEWQDGQFHAIVPTASKPHGRYLVRIEVFDAGGNRLEPGPAAFTFRRWDTPATTQPITYGALTHLLRTDNRKVAADVVDVTGPGATGGDCKFFVGNGSDVVTIAYRAFHPQPGMPSFMLDYSLTVRRGISGGLATPALTSSTEAGEGVLPAQHPVTVADLLDGEEKCSFAVNLHVRARIHNGSGRLSYLDAHDVAAFAVELG